MINETLYQLATDELNSDQRKPEIWARACALASNDHDEARYLYTNLRVEQMIAAQAKKDKELTRSGGLPASDLSLEEQDETVESTRTGQTSRANLLADDLEIESEPPQHSSVSGNAANLALMLDDFDLDPADVASMNAAEPGTASSIHGKLAKEDGQQPGEKKAISMENDPLAYWAQQHQEQLRISEQNYSPAAQDKDTPFGKELERQADELPGQQSEIISAESNTPDVESKPDYSPQNQPAYAVDESAEQRAPSSSDSPVHFDYADDDDNIASDIINTPAPRAGSGKRFYVYSRGGRTLAVKDGVSWPAMLLTLPWLLKKGMLGISIVYAVLWVILIAGLLSSGFAWLDAAPDASTAIKMWTGLFALVALVALFYLPFRHGNEWFQKKLIRRGYELDALVHAKNRREAINASFDSATF